MTQTLYVTKRDGLREPLDLDKIHRVIDWAAERLQNVSVSQVELRSHIQFYDGIKTADIHETIIKAAADLISKETPDYQYMAARLAVFHLRKKAYGQFEPPKLYDHVVKMVEEKRYVDPLDQVLNESMGSQEDEPEILLTDLLKTIQAAKTDERIKAIVLDLSSFGSGSIFNTEPAGNISKRSSLDAAQKSSDAGPR